MSCPGKVIVVKVGGASLFSSGSEFSELRQYVRSLQELPNTLSLLIVGGGETVESMRILHRYHPELDPKRMHWRCVRLLESTSDAAAELLQLQRLNTTPFCLDQIANKLSQGCYLVDVGSFYHRDSLDWIPSPLVPAETWDTTSDTLAWLLAFRVQAHELQWIKKPDCSEIESVEQATSLGVLDPQLLLLLQNQPSDWKLQLNLVYHSAGWQKKKIHWLNKA
jgi:aspartokinase-like uncharacterized kinase